MSGSLAPTLILSLVSVVVLLFVVFRLIRKNEANQRKALAVNPSEIRHPFSETAVFPTGFVKPNNASQAGMESVIRRAAEEWKNTCILPDLEPGRSFIPIGVKKVFLRYRYSATSLGQAMGMWASLMLAGEDPRAQEQFDNLLALLMANPSREYFAFSSWQIIPDLRPSRRQEADLHAESWLVWLLLKAKEQWPEKNRFDYEQLALAKMEALQQAEHEDDQGLSLPLFWEDFHALGHGEVRREKTDNFSGEEGEGPEQVLQALHLGLYQLSGRSEKSGKQSGYSARGLERVLNTFARGVGQESEDELRSGQFSALAQLCCYTPLIMASAVQTLVNQLWQLLETTQPSPKDAYGATLRLLALLLMAGKGWMFR
ncbi:MAG: hypothetical protein ACOYKD_06095 [Anaerolineaceae bacterium]|jgi:hypothetical protein